MSHSLAKIKSLFDVILNQESYAEWDADNILYKKINTIYTLHNSCV